MFKDIAQRGKSTIGYFFGFKLHLAINDRREIIDCLITLAMLMTGNRYRTQISLK